MGDRQMVGQQPLKLRIMVRIHVPQPIHDRLSSSRWINPMKLFYKTITFLMVNIPHLLVWLSLAILVHTTLQTFFKNGDFVTVLQLFFSAIALIIALASVTFSYSKTKEYNREEYSKLVSAGEMFFWAALMLIMILLISWLAFRFDNFSRNYYWYTYIKWPVGIVFAIPFSLLIFVANSLSKGIKVLEKNLSGKIKRSIDVF
jgi:hypothetical protein